jgi:acyl carrier protein
MADSKAAVATLSEEYILDRLRVLAREELEMKPDDIARVGPDTLLVEGLQLDSLRQVVLVTSIEGQFGFELTHEDRDRLVALRTVGDLIHLIRERAVTG